MTPAQRAANLQHNITQAENEGFPLPVADTLRGLVAIVRELADKLESLGD